MSKKSCCTFENLRNNERVKRVIGQTWLKLLGIKKNENHFNRNISVLLFQFDISHYSHLEFFGSDEDCQLSSILNSIFISAPVTETC